MPPNADYHDDRAHGGEWAYTSAKTLLTLRMSVDGNETPAEAKEYDLPR